MNLSEESIRKLSNPCKIVGLWIVLVYIKTKSDSQKFVFSIWMFCGAGLCKRRCIRKTLLSGIGTIISHSSSPQTEEFKSSTDIEKRFVIKFIRTWDITHFSKQILLIPFNSQWGKPWTSLIDSEACKKCQPTFKWASAK